MDIDNPNYVVTTDDSDVNVPVYTFTTYEEMENYYYPQPIYVQRDEYCYNINNGKYSYNSFDNVENDNLLNNTINNEIIVETTQTELENNNISYKISKSKIYQMILCISIIFIMFVLFCFGVIGLVTKYLK